MSLYGARLAIIMQGIVIEMNEQQLQTLEQLQAFLDGTTAIEGQLRRRWCCAFWSASAAILAGC